MTYNCFIVSQSRLKKFTLAMDFHKLFWIWAPRFIESVRMTDWISQMSFSMNKIHIRFLLNNMFLVYSLKQFKIRMKPIHIYMYTNIFNIYIFTRSIPISDHTNDWGRNIKSSVNIILCSWSCVAFKNQNNIPLS